jgi:hypothetical protein
MSKAVYTVQAQRSGDWWAVSSRDKALRGLFSQARRYREVEGMAREAIALLLGVDEGDVSVVVEPVLGEELDAAVRKRKDLIVDMETAQRAASAHSATLVAKLAAMGLSQRDVADVLGVSFQRISQLWPDSPGPVDLAPSVEDRRPGSGRSHATIDSRTASSARSGRKVVGRSSVTGRSSDPSPKRRAKAKG